jgi:hypothetical protein
MKSKIISLFKFLSGFLGWYLVVSIYWIVLYSWGGGFQGPEAMIIIFCGFPPLILTVMAFIVLLLFSFTRWIGVGLLSALLFNSFAILIIGVWRGGLDFLHIFLSLLINMPFPLQLTLYSSLFWGSP